MSNEKKNDVTEKELRELTGVYKELNPTNRVLTLSISGLLLTSQKTNEPDQKAG